MSEPGNETKAEIKQVSAYLRCHNAAAAIRFYKTVFGAEEAFRLTEPSDRVAHAELLIGPSVIMVSDEYPEMGCMSPTSLDGTSVGIYLQVSDVDGVFKQAITEGAMALSEPTDQFYGERSGKLRDPWGHEWLIGQRKEDLSPVEMQERFDAMMSDTKE